VSLDPAEPVSDEEKTIEPEEVLSSEEVLGRALMGLVSSPVRMVKVGTQVARALPVRADGGVERRPGGTTGAGRSCRYRWRT